MRDIERLLGGASRETWSFTVDGRRLVLRRDPPGVPRSGAMSREADLLRAAAAVGVPVPEVVAAGDDTVVMTWLPGETLARRILRDDTFATARSSLTQQCGAALARLHSGVRRDDVEGLPVEEDAVAGLRAMLDRLGEPHPGLELALARLERNRPPSRPAVVVHGDFRLGNLMVGPHGLVGVLDWELSHVGDPVEDLGWLCVRSWRFGGPQPVAGIGSRAELIAAYAEAGGGEVSLGELHWWELLGTVRWGVICVQQAATHLTGAVRSVELAAIGRRTAEVELDALEILAPDVVRTAAQEDGGLPVVTSPHDRPHAAELLDAVAEWVDGLPLAGYDAFQGRVVRRVLALAGREATLGPALAQRHADRLAALGVRSDAELAAQARAGRDDAETLQAVVAATVDRLRVADPAQLQR